VAEAIMETGPPRGFPPGGANAPAATPRPPTRWLPLLLAAGAVFAVLLIGAALGMSLQMARGVPAQLEAGAVDVGFAQDMSVHHRQAVLMAGLARDRSTDPATRLIAFDIETNQLEQIGRMQGWLSLWNAAALPAGRYMTWMTDADSMPGMAHGSGPSASGLRTMPGMASPADLQRLRALTGAQFDVVFLQLMLRHHQGGTPMARYAAGRAETAQVRNLAEKIVVSQGAESDYLVQLIAQRGAQPLPPPS
jgi:uncharacterized protein (DUF305 family)